MLWRELEDESRRRAPGPRGHRQPRRRDRPGPAPGARRPGRTSVHADAGGGAGAVGRHPVRHPGRPHPEAGRLDAEEAVAALQSEAARHEGEVLLDTRVDSISVRDDDRVEVRTAGRGVRRRHRRRHRGRLDRRSCWAATVTLPKLVVTQEQPAHFAVSRPHSRVAGLQPPARAGQRPLRLLVLPGLRHAHPRRGRQSRLARRRAGHRPGRTHLRARAGPARGAPALRPRLAPRGRRRCADPDQLHLHLDQRHRLRRSTGSVRSSSGRASRATGSSSCPRSVGSWPTWSRARPRPTPGSPWAGPDLSSGLMKRCCATSVTPSRSRCRTAPRAEAPAGPRGCRSATTRGTRSSRACPWAATTSARSPILASSTIWADGRWTTPDVS